MKANQKQNNLAERISQSVIEIVMNNDIDSPSNYNLISEDVEMIANNHDLSNTQRAKLDTALSMIYEVLKSHTEQRPQTKPSDF